MCYYIDAAGTAESKKENAVGEKTSDFARRMVGEVGNFAGQKGRQIRRGITERIQDGTDIVLSAAEEKAYPMAINLVAKRYSITQEEAERRLSQSSESVVT